MEKVFFVVKGNLDEVNKELSKGGKLKYICPIAENVTSTGNCGGSCYDTTGQICAYVVVEYAD